MMSDELASAIADSRRMRERKRVKVRPFVRGRPRGRPIRHTGTYFTRPVLVDDETMLKIRKNRRHGEPLGSVVRRLIGFAEQKNPIAPIERYQPEVSILDDPDQYKKVWEMFDKK